MTHTNGANSTPSREGLLGPSKAGVTIGKGAYLGAYVLVLQGVRVGENSIVGAGSLVRKDVNDGYLYFGVPGRNIRSIVSGEGHI